MAGLLGPTHHNHNNPTHDTQLAANASTRMDSRPQRQENQPFWKLPPPPIHFSCPGAMSVPASLRAGKALFLATGVRASARHAWSPVVPLLPPKGMRAAAAFSVRRAMGSSSGSGSDLSPTIVRQDGTPRTPFRGPLKAAILDWSGTTADAHVIAPAVVFHDVFAKHGVPISMARQLSSNQLAAWLPACSHGLLACR